jgi:hypothetical protein
MSSSKNAASGDMCFMPIGPTSDRDSSPMAVPNREEYERFYILYGECFSVWSSIEFQLLSIYVFLLNSQEYDAASAAFYSATGFRAKIDMVHVVVTNSKRADDNDRNVWLKIYNTALKISARRNDLAHKPVYFGRLSELGKRTMFIADSRTPKKGSQLHVHDLMAIKKSFSKCRMELLHFWLSLLKKISPST